MSTENKPASAGAALPPLRIDARGRFVGFPYCLCGHQRGAHAIGDPGGTWAECRMDSCSCTAYLHEESAAVTIESLPEIAERIAHQLLARVWEYIKTNRRKPSVAETAHLLEPIHRAEAELLTNEQAETLGVEVATAWLALLARALVEVKAEQQRRRERPRAAGDDGSTHADQGGGHHAQ